MAGVEGLTVDRFNALARCGAGDEARRRFDMAITVGERMGPPPSHGGRT